MLRLKLNRRLLNYTKGRAKQRSRLAKGAQPVYSLQIHTNPLLQTVGFAETCKAVIAPSFSVMILCNRSFSSAAPPSDARLEVLLPIPVLFFASTAERGERAVYVDRPGVEF